MFIKTLSFCKTAGKKAQKSVLVFLVTKLLRNLYNIYFKIFIQIFFNKLVLFNSINLLVMSKILAI